MLAGSLYPVYTSLGCVLILAQSFLQSCLKHWPIRQQAGQPSLRNISSKIPFQHSIVGKDWVFFLSWKLLREFCGICLALPSFPAGFLPSTLRMFTEYESILSKTISTTRQLWGGQESTWRYVPDHCSQEPGSIDNGRYSLVHQWMCFDEVQGIIRELVRGYIFF